jgi:hypothetical protein
MKKSILDYLYFLLIIFVDGEIAQKKRGCNSPCLSECLESTHLGGSDEFSRTVIQTFLRF